MPSFIHIDKGAETSTPATMYCFVCRQYRDVETDEEAVKTVCYIWSINFKRGSFSKCSWYVCMVLSKMTGVFRENDVISNLFCLLFQSQLYTENICVISFFMFFFYAPILYFIHMFFQNQFKKYFFKVIVVKQNV